MIAIDEEESVAAEPMQPKTPDEDSDAAAEETPETTQAWRPWWIMAAGLLVIVVIGIGVFFWAGKKREDR